MSRTDRRVLTINGLLFTVATIAVITMVLLPDRAREIVDAIEAGREEFRVARDTTGTCIPANPTLQQQCDPLREALWKNQSGEYTGFLQAMHATSSGEAPNVFASHLRFRAEAGDLAVAVDLARVLGVADVRVVAAGLSEDPVAEYIEVRNVGAAPARLDGLTLQTGNGGHRFVFAPVLRFPGALAPEESCRVYTRPVGQPDACAGEWEPAPDAAIWRFAGGEVMLLGSATSASPARDRWWYAP